MSGVRLYAFKLCNEAIISPWTMGGQRGRPWHLSLSKTRQHKWISFTWMSHTTHKQVYISMTTSDDLSVVITTLLYKCSVHMGMTMPIFTCTFSGLHLTQLWYYCGDRISQTERQGGNNTRNWVTLILNLKLMWARGVKWGASGPFPTLYLCRSSTLTRTIPIFKLSLDFLFFFTSTIHL